MCSSLVMCYLALIGEIIVIEKTEELLTVGEVARSLRVDETTVRRWIKNGALEAITLPHRSKRQRKG